MMMVMVLKIMVVMVMVMVMVLVLKIMVVMVVPGLRDLLDLRLRLLAYTPTFRNPGVCLPTDLTLRSSVFFAPSWHVTARCHVG